MMSRKRRTLDGEVVTSLILEVFRFNGRLLVAGDRLVSELGLTSARWQVMGVIALSSQPEPVARLARSMGLNRQGVQRIVNELAAEGLVAFQPNPITGEPSWWCSPMKGRSGGQLQGPWANALARGLDPKVIAAATRIIEALRIRLENELNVEPDERE
jgi:hypothetical protein